MPHAPRSVPRAVAGRLAATIVAVAAMILLLAGCSGDDAQDASATSAMPPVDLPDRLVPTSTIEVPDDDAAPSTTTPPTGVVIDEFVVRTPPVCDGADYEATLEWTARNAVAATVLVDGTQVAASVPAEGPFTVTLPCDGIGHAVGLVLVDGDGDTVIRTQAVLPGPGG